MVHIQWWSIVITAINVVTESLLCQCVVHIRQLGGGSYNPTLSPRGTRTKLGTISKLHTEGWELKPEHANNDVTVVKEIKCCPQIKRSF